MLTISYQQRSYQLDRYPYPSNSTWLPWTTAEQYALRYVDEHFPAATALALYQDRFGVLATLWANRSPSVVLTHASQQAALVRQLSANGIASNAVHLQRLLEPWEQPISLAVLQLPKSLDLLEWYFQHLSAQLTPSATVVVGFMTRHFSPRLLELAGCYFSEVQQTLAWKKARLLVLTSPKPPVERPLRHYLSYQQRTFEQYYGVFSAQHIDYASQFLLEHLPPPVGHSIGLDIACGNGILGLSLQQQTPSATVTYVDDFEPALASAKINCPTTTAAHFHWNYHLNDLPRAAYDWAVCNPPFHQEHDITTSIAKGLFEQAVSCLKSQGRLWIIANRHLKYGGLLRACFPRVELLAQNSKFIAYECTKE